MPTTGHGIGMCLFETFTTRFACHVVCRSDPPAVEIMTPLYNLLRHIVNNATTNVVYTLERHD